MKHILTLAFILFAFSNCLAQRHISPSGTFPVGDTSAADYHRAYDDLDHGKTDGREIFEDNPIYNDLYSPSCSWYCGGSVKRLSASSSLKPQGNKTYFAAKAHDFNHETVWSEGVPGYGVGEYLLYEFEGNCPRITTIRILNGYVKNEKKWTENSRVKQILVRYNDEPYVILDLEDSRTLQWFDIGIVGYGPEAGVDTSWTLKFEIMDVYPGTKYDDTVISELYFDGLDSHSLYH